MTKSNERVLSPAKVIFGYSGFCMMIVGIALLFPLWVLFFYPEEVIYAKNFIIPSAVAILIGFLMFKPIYRKKADLDKNYDNFIVVLAWIFAVIVCACPYLLTGNYTVTQSVFEATSGLTTTGITVKDVDHLPKIYLMFRSTTLYVGGIGIILIMTSLFATTFGMRLYNAEGHPNKLIPNVIKSARMIVYIYTGYMIVGAILFVIFGMHPFDAINHSIAAVSSGGFSTKSRSIGYYHSIPIEIIAMVLMILGTTNFMLNLMILKGKFKIFLNHCEVKLTIVAWVILVPILACALLGGVCATFGESFRVSLFHIVSAMSTTGFQITESFHNWPTAGMFILAVLMMIGFQNGSTSAGIKEYRVAIILKSIYYDIKSKLVSKRVVIPRKINMYGENVDLTPERTFDAHNGAMLYLGVISIGTLIYTMCGNSVADSMFEFASILSCVGLSTGISGAAAGPIANWVAIVGMLIGRLDFYPVILVTLLSCKGIGKGVRRMMRKEDTD